MSEHTVEIVEDHGFARAVCSCGWSGSGFRTRESARQQAQAHLATAHTTS